MRFIGNNSLLERLSLYPEMTAEVSEHFCENVGYRVFNTMSILLDQGSSGTRNAGVHL